MKGADTLALKGYGKADLELDVPTPERAVYEIGSVTKQFTAAAMLQLQDEGKLSLDGKVEPTSDPCDLGEGEVAQLRKVALHKAEEGIFAIEFCGEPGPVCIGREELGVDDGVQASLFLRIELGNLASQCFG